MAIAIKSVPILEGKEAEKFSKKVLNNLKKKSSVDFSKQIAISAAILAKAKI